MRYLFLSMFQLIRAPEAFMHLLKQAGTVIAQNDAYTAGFRAGLYIGVDHPAVAAELARQLRSKKEGNLSIPGEM